MRYAYQRGGQPILQWGTRAPLASRAADNVALGSLGGSTLEGPTLVLPRPGAPEPVGITRSAMGDCSCKGSCGCTGVGGVVDAIPGGYVTIGIGVLLAWKFLKR